MPETSFLQSALHKWLESCERRGGISRNTVAVGIVILDHLRRECPVAKENILSKGGEISGSRAGLRNVLTTYGLPENYLKEVTTRQAHQDGQRFLEALGYGAKIAKLKAEEREGQLVGAIQELLSHATKWLQRQHLKVSCDRQSAPGEWVRSILEEAKGRSGGRVEQHLVGAKLELRHPDVEIPNFPSHASDSATGRTGDFRIGTTCFHITATPGQALLRKAAENLSAGLHPYLLVPRDQVSKAYHLAEDQGIFSRISILGIEDFVAANIVEMCAGKQEEFAAKLQAIIERYNRRLKEVETDTSLEIELQ
jgi:hypothetical protein